MNGYRAKKYPAGMVYTKPGWSFISMDLDFISELEEAISNVGTDTIWKREIGGVLIWISPISLSAQEKVSERVSKLEDVIVISESKRLTLSHSIVGIKEFDLSQYRNAGPLFPIRDKEGKVIKVTLDRYVYEKLGQWGAEFLDNLFSVYADLMESFGKENLKDIKFENAKSPHEELAELESRVHEMRDQLGMLPLVEKVDVEDIAEEDIEKNTEETVELAGDFNPFNSVNQELAPDPKVASRAQEIAETEDVFGDAASRAASANPNTVPPAVQRGPVVQERDDVLEAPAHRALDIKPPIYDKTTVSRNPRFAPSKGK